MSESSGEPTEYVESASESDGHPADELILSKAAKRAAKRRLEQTSQPDADASVSDGAQQPRKKKKRKKSPKEPASPATAAPVAKTPAATASLALGTEQRTQLPDAAPSNSNAKHRKGSGAAALLSPSNAQQLAAKSPAIPAALAAASAAGAAAAAAASTVRPDAEDAAVPRTPAPLGVIVINDDEAAAPNSELQRLLRQPRSASILTS